MRPVYVVSGGVSKFKKARKDVTFQMLVKEAYDYAICDIGLEFQHAAQLIDDGVASYFSDHFLGQLKAAPMVMEYLGLLPKPVVRIEGGGATGGLCFQEAVKHVASGDAEISVAFGWETMSHVLTWKGNEFIALASDTNFDYPVGGFYSGYYAMMVTRHMKEFGTTVEQMARISVKNHRNAVHNPYAQHAGLIDLGNKEKVEAAKLTVPDVRHSAMVAWPLTRLDICTMSDGAAVCILASEKGLRRLTKAGATLGPCVQIASMGRGSDAMRMADRPHGKVILLPHESEKDYRGLNYPGVHSFRAGRMATKQAYKRAHITDPLNQLDFVELHDAYTSSEIQTYEDMGLCRYGQGGKFVDTGAPFLSRVDYSDLHNENNFLFSARSTIPINPSGGLIACGHPVGATGLMQAVFALWQLQGSIEKHFGNDMLQVHNARRGAIHSHAGTGTFVTVSILEREE